MPRLNGPSCLSLIMKPSFNNCIGVQRRIPSHGRSPVNRSEVAERHVVRLPLTGNRGKIGFERIPGNPAIHHGFQSKGGNFSRRPAREPPGPRSPTNRPVAAPARAWRRIRRYFRRETVPLNTANPSAWALIWLLETPPITLSFTICQTSGAPPRGAEIKSALTSAGAGFSGGGCVVFGRGGVFRGGMCRYWRKRAFPMPARKYGPERGYPMPVCAALAAYAIRCRRDVVKNHDKGKN